MVVWAGNSPEYHHLQDIKRIYISREHDMSSTTTFFFWHNILLINVVSGLLMKLPLQYTAKYTPLLGRLGLLDVMNLLILPLLEILSTTALVSFPDSTRTIYSNWE